MSVLRYSPFFVLLFFGAVNIYAQEKGIEQKPPNDVEVIQNIRKDIDYVRANISDIIRKIDSMGERLRSFQEDVTQMGYEIERLFKMMEELGRRVESIEDILSSIDIKQYGERLSHVDSRIRYLMGRLDVAYGGIIVSFFVLLILIFATRGRKIRRREFTFRR